MAADSSSDSSKDITTALLATLPEALRDAVRTHPIVAAMGAEGGRVLAGFCEVVRADDGGARVRVHLTLGLGEAVDLRPEDIRYALNFPTFGGVEATALWVAADAELAVRTPERGRPAGAGQLLRGEISDAYVAAADRAALLQAPPRAEPRAAMRGGDIRPTYDCG